MSFLSHFALIANITSQVKWFRQDSPNPDSNSIIECSFFTESRFGFTIYPNPDFLIEYSPRLLTKCLVYNVTPWHWRGYQFALQRIWKALRRNIKLTNGSPRYAWEMAIKGAFISKFECLHLWASDCFLLVVNVVLKEKAGQKSPKAHRSAVPSGRSRQRKVSTAALIVLLYLTDMIRTSCYSNIETHRIVIIFNQLVVLAKWHPCCLMRGF